MKHALTQIFALGLLINTGQAQTTLYSNNFSNGSSGWNLGGVQQTNFDLWVVNSIYFCSSTTPNQGDGRYLHVGNDLFGDYCAYSLFAGFGSSGSVSASMTSGINTVGSSSVELSFDWLCAGQVGVLESYGFLQYSTNGGGSWTDITQPRQKYNGQSTWTSITITSSHVPGFLNQNNLRFRFGWQNSGYGANPTFSIDNMVVTGSSGPVCTNVGGASSSNPTPICTDQTSLYPVRQETSSGKARRLPQEHGRMFPVEAVLQQPHIPPVRFLQQPTSGQNFRKLAVLMNTHPFRQFWSLRMNRLL